MAIKADAGLDVRELRRRLPEMLHFAGRGELGPLSCSRSAPFLTAVMVPCICWFLSEDEQNLFRMFPPSALRKFPFKYSSRWPITRL